MKKLIVKKESLGIRLSRTNTDQTFLIENSEIFGLLLTYQKLLSTKS